jgi:tetratricopeptide (TPR) repeat protein
LHQHFVNSYLDQVSLTARKAVQARDWARVRACAREILKHHKNSAEGHFLIGLAEKAANRTKQAIKSFSEAISLDDRRYDAATELAGQYLHLHQFGQAVAVLQPYESAMSNSPRYLDMAGTIYTNVGLPDRAWPLYHKASMLQPGVDSLQANLAACSVYIGKIDEAKEIYQRLLQKSPNHQRNHYELSRLDRATDTKHVEQMKAVLKSTKLPPERNIYLYYAIGKELEDLEQWDDAFQYYKMAGDAAASVANYDVQKDLRLIDTIIEVCDKEWLTGDGRANASDNSGKTPIFIAGLPRSGTTLTERILSCHSMVESAGESYFMQIVIKHESGVISNEQMNPEIVEAASTKDIRGIADGYMQAVSYKLCDKAMFIEKFPENFLYLGFIAKAFPHASIILLTRNPMDSCFALYKQSFFRYAYSLDDLGQYYVAFDRLRDHWRRELADRLIEIEYESLVADQEGQTRQLLEDIGLEFEEACLHFELNKAATNTASTVQIREKIHNRSVKRWKRFEKHLQPLKSILEDAGIKVT